MTENSALGPPLQIVYGSCVSRDLVEYALGGKKAVARYVARHSLISAFDHACADVTVPLEATLSPFQRRMVEDDIRSVLPQRLHEAATIGVERVLWDLVDERLGVYVFENGAAVTRSIDLMASGLDARLAERAHLLPFGSTEHFDRWSSALGEFGGLIAQLDLEVVLIDIPWAERDDRGVGTPTSFGISARQANQMSRRYIDAARSVFNSISLQAEETVAAHDHRWGPAPFHYTLETYRRAALAFASASPGASRAP